MIKGSDGSTIRLYQFQPESFNNNLLKASAAISITKEGSTDPVFGVAWLEAVTSTQGQQVQIASMKVSSIKLPGDISDENLESLGNDLENNGNALDIEIPLNELQSSLELNNQQKELSGQISNKAPKVIYSTSPSILVVIDGEPKIQHNDKWGVDAVVNTPFTLVKSDGSFYLHGGKHWYMAPSAKGPYSLTTTVSTQLRKIEEQLKAQTSQENKENQENQEAEKDENVIYKIVVSTQPAELIQSSGEAKFSSLENTGLLFVSNSGDDIFMDVDSQNYYVLISGRWYHSKTLSGNWEYTAADKLPADFAKIPEGSPKDHVLASVAGTEAANDAVQEAAVPQTAKVDRNSAQAEVAYDGDPKFEDIDGTDLDYAVNTPASVIRWKGRYYSVDNGVWFESARATGPWVVSVRRPYAVALIPPSYPVYHMKYVYIYDVTPEYVYMGYTPGYLNTFVYGPTVVYGTGFYYRPWFGTHYYARPYTWGFNVRYNPWMGWGLGYHYSSGWFNINIGIGHQPWGYWGGGWWGPRYYRPSYCWSPSRYGGSYYGRNNYYYNRNHNYNYANRNYSGNIYRNRSGLISRDYQRISYNTRSRFTRNGDWSNNNRSNRPGSYNNGNNYNNRNDNNRYNNSNNNNRYNNRDNNNRENIGNRPSNRTDRPVREYNPARRTDPYGRNNNINPGATPNNNGNRERVNPANSNGNRYNNTNRDPNNNRNVDPNRNNRNNGNISPRTNGDNQTEMPGRISRPERGERLNSNRPENNNSRPVSPSLQTQPQPRPERQIQSRPERQIQSRPERQSQPQMREVQRRSDNGPSMRQRESSSQGRSAERSNGSPGGRRGERG